VTGITVKVHLFHHEANACLQVRLCTVSLMDDVMDVMEVLDK
jgi:hypothetical protein